ncbi:protein of unknown function [Mariniphaga anaerophila]|uniref:3-keto-disaccharide hydrolase domain-containing protein n=1 Tax=Mariniphaga anaerophila TaxID=1484053 RepID=A0A1M4WKJ9_9BACT|nr:DUF1961 family protein [Mariniphaga anaerophila]SHE81758.1 protein of unknown function [Mariniphaga anaerophila]
MRIKTLIIFSILLLFSVLVCLGQGRLIFQYNFDENDSLADWKIEGEGKAFVENGKLILEPGYYPLLKLAIDEGKLSLENRQEEYQHWLVDAMTKKYGKDIEKYYITGEDGNSVFRGGHFNFWNKKYPTPDDFAIEFEFVSLSPAPLQMIMFCARGKNGESIFAPSMPVRYGLAQEIMYDPMVQYRISYFHPSRKTANMRRAPGRELVAEGRDAVSETPRKMHLCRVEKVGNQITYSVDGDTILTFCDNDPLNGGYWGFRLMACAKGEYDNIKIFDLSEY